MIIYALYLLDKLIRGFISSFQLNKLELPFIVSRLLLLTINISQVPISRIDLTAEGLLLLTALLGLSVMFFYLFIKRKEKVKRNKSVFKNTVPVK